VATNLTLAVDERIVEQARQAARAMGKSLNQVVREHLEHLAGQAQREAIVAELRALSGRGAAPAGGWRFDRESVYADRIAPGRGA
jgi:hypothetical protein